MFYTSRSAWFSVYFFVSFLLLVHLTFFAPCLTCPYHFSLFSVIFFVTGDIFGDPLTGSFLILPFFVTPHIHRGLLVSCTSSLVSCLFCVDHVAVITEKQFAALSKSLTASAEIAPMSHCIIGAILNSYFRMQRDETKGTDNKEEGKKNNRCRSKKPSG